TARSGSYPISARLLPLPIAPRSISERSTRKKFPSIHSAWVVMVHLLDAAPGAGVWVPSAVQSPANISSFFSSAAAVGGPICALAGLIAAAAKNTSHAADHSERLMRPSPSRTDRTDRGE